VITLPAYAENNPALELLADFTYREHVPVSRTTSTVEGKVRALFNILNRQDEPFTAEELAYQSKIGHKCARYICVRLSESGEVLNAGERPPAHKGRPAPLFQGTQVLAATAHSYNELLAEVISEKLGQDDLPATEVRRRAAGMMGIAHGIHAPSADGLETTIGWQLEAPQESITYRALGCFAQAHGVLDYTHSRVHELTWSQPVLEGVPQTEYRSAPIIIRPTGINELD
jgi:hypothetical protein